MDVPGIDNDSLQRWLHAHLPDLGGLNHVELITGGRSNLTYRLSLDDRTIVLRRPPLGHVLPTAHDMGREYRVLSALSGTGVPVPEPLVLCSETSVIGAPFYLMSYVDGVVIRTEEQAAELDERQAGSLCERLTETLAAIHGVDTHRAGLADFGRPDGYLARQLRRWNQQWQRSTARELPAYDTLVRRLGESLPERSDGCLVHGDYRLDNALLRLDGVPRVAAVVDWEMSTLGDPLADLGLTLTYWTDRDDEERRSIPVGATATAAPGFWSGAEFAARYAELSGNDVGNIAYYVAFGHFKLAVVLEGIHARYRAGATVGEGFESVGESVPVLIDRALRILDRASM